MLLDAHAPMPLVVTCAHCREEVLEADQIGDAEECALRAHLLAVHPTAIQPETRRAVAAAKALRDLKNRDRWTLTCTVSDELGVLARKPLEIECEEGDLNPHWCLAH